MRRAFRSIEDHELGDNGIRGVGGPVHISVGNFRYPLAERLIEAGEQADLKRKDDLNHLDQEGVGYFSHTIKKGRRQSASLTFLKPVRHRPNLKIGPDRLVDRVLFEDRRATSVACRHHGQPVIFQCSKEVILSAGAVHSPKILQLSGIGPAAFLGSHGIPVLHDSPDVGARLHEHLGFTLTRRLKGDRGFNHRFHGLGMAASILQYLAFHSGRPRRRNVPIISVAISASRRSPNFWTRRRCRVTRCNQTRTSSTWSIEHPLDIITRLPA